MGKKHSSLALWRIALSCSVLLGANTVGQAGKVALPAAGPVPLASPFAATPKPGAGPFGKDGIITSAIPRTDRTLVSGKLKDGLDALYNKRTAARAIQIRNSLSVGSLDHHILTWALATSGVPEMRSSDISAAMDELSSWPGKNVMRRNFERAVARENRPTGDVIALFGKRRPETTEGMVALGNALAANGQKARAHAIIAPWWYKAKLTMREERLVFDKLDNGILNQNDHLIRMKAMLYAYRLGSAQRVAGYAKAKSLYDAFEAVARSQRDAGKKLANVDPSWRKDPIYTFARIQYLRRAEKYDEAAKLMLKTPKDAASLIDPDAWWTERRVLSREMLDLNKTKLAYQLAAAHAAESPVMAADAEFHAGWYALRFLNDPKTAAKHFARIPELSSRPISAARGYYWLGRAAEAGRNSEQARSYFQRAAQYGTTFYGQLSASRLGQSKLAIGYPKPTAEDRRRFETRETVKALRRLEAAGYGTQAAFLYRELSEDLKSPGELALLTAMAERRSDHYTSLKIGKNAVSRGLNVGALSHPLGAIPASANISASGKALAYAIARQESEFNPTAVSGAGARGMLQLLPTTAKAVAIKRGMAYSAQKLSNDPGYNATLGAHFLGEQLERFNGSYILTFVGYNAGPRRANEWISRYGDPRGRNIDDVVDWVERIPYTETRNYVQRVMENYEVYKGRLTGTTDIKIDLVAGRRMN